MKFAKVFFQTKSMPTTELQARLHCNCGREVIAHSRDAGRSLACSCGNSVTVPSLSQFRVLAGDHAYVTNPAEAIQKLQRAGKEPAGHECLCCGASNVVFFECRANCEQSHLKKSRKGQYLTNFLTWLVLPLFLHIFILLRREEPTIERQGHDVEVKFRLQLCQLCLRSIGSPTRPSVAKELMRKVPLLAELLRYYPKLSLKTVRLEP